MKTDVAFTGTGHIGVLKKEYPDSHPRIDPAYEAVEDYIGSFRVYEMVDEYGQTVRSEKNVTGYGYVAVDKRVSDSQRTYESGTGSYQSDEQIETAHQLHRQGHPAGARPDQLQLQSQASPPARTSSGARACGRRSGPLAGGLMLAKSSRCGSLERRLRRTPARLLPTSARGTHLSTTWTRRPWPRASMR